MAKKRRSMSGEGSAIDMTPMIDVVFQLIIFFIVTINISEAKDESVRLEFAPHGIEVDSGSSKSTSALVIDVSSRGRVSINNRALTVPELQKILMRRFKSIGNTFEVWVRGDARASHDMIRKVMDTCTASGIGRVSFVAVKDPRTPETRKFYESRRSNRRRG